MQKPTHDTCSVAVSVAKHLGARRVIAVGREGTALRRTTERGADALIPLVADIASVVGPANIVFEAPTKAAQAWFVKQFGPSVNLGNIPPDEVIPLGDGLGAALTRIGSDGVDVVLDFLWGGVATTAMAALARSAPHPQHRIDWVNLGALDGATIPLDATLLRMSDLHVWGSGAGAYSPDRRREAVDATLDLAARGVIAVDVEERRLADVGATWNDRGRLVYTP